MANICSFLFVQLPVLVFKEGGANTFIFVNKNYKSYGCEQSYL